MSISSDIISTFYIPLNFIRTKTPDYVKWNTYSYIIYWIPPFLKIVGIHTD